MTSFIEQTFQPRRTVAMVQDNWSGRSSMGPKSTESGRNPEQFTTQASIAARHSRSAHSNRSSSLAPGQSDNADKRVSSSHKSDRHQIMTDLSKIVMTCQERQVTLSKFEAAKNKCQSIWKDDATAQWRVADERMKAAQEDLEHLWSQATNLEPSETQCLTNISDMLVLKDKRWTPQLVERVLQGKPAWLDANIV